MAGTIFLQQTAHLYPRTTPWLAGRTCYSAKGATCGYSTNTPFPEHILARLIYLSEGNYSLATRWWLRKSRSRCSHIFNNINFNKPVLFSTKYTCRPLSYSFCKGTSNTNNANKPTATDDPEFKAISSEISRDFDSEFPRIKNEVTEDEEGQYQQMKAADSNILDNSLYISTKVNKKDAEFEYDYQVAEDIEEYDYIDESRLAEQQVRPEKVLPISLQRGKTGVFDLDELVTLLEHLGAENIVTFPVPHEANFCDHMVVVSAKSQRHLQAINDEMLWVHKRKKSQKDSHLVIEGMDKTTWCAMDIGNIVLHVFYGDDQREFYDIESLWTLGPANDPKCQEQSGDPYALSAEDLFWLETKNSAVKVTDTANSGDHDTDGSDKRVKSAQAKVGVSLQSKKWPDDVTDREAGWGISKPT